MNILFLTIQRINDISDRGIYPDLMRKFSLEGHKVFIITPVEKRYRQKTTLVRENNISILKLRSLNIQKTNAVSKWLSIYFLNGHYLRGIKKHFANIKFDLIIYSTPPITFSNLIQYIKQRHGAISYLLLKDIFPQNAVDLGLFKRGGILHRYFLTQEKKLYGISDYIGCMSPANVEYLRKNNPELSGKRIEVNPNSHELFDEPFPANMKEQLRLKYGIPLNSTLFIYGGNLGKPQGIDFVVDFLRSQKNQSNRHFLIIGSGTDYKKIKLWIDLEKPLNVMLLPALPKDEYNYLLRSSDIGMIFLDSRFTIPNFPSRLLSYLEYKLPVMAATDTNTDLGKIIENNKFGYWSKSGDIQSLNQNVNRLVMNPVLREAMGMNGFRYFLANYTVNNSYNIIMKHFQ